MSDRIPANFLQTIEDFLTFLEQAKTNPQTDPKLWEKLKILEGQLNVSEDKILELAITIKSWCKDNQITFNSEELATLRANMLKKGQEIPKPAEGERPEIIYNKALLIEKVQQAKEDPA